MINDLPFIVDDVLETKDSNFDFTINNKGCIQFEGILEVKNRFPGTNLDSKKYIENNLKCELIIICDKVVAFYELKDLKILQKLELYFFMI